MPDHIDTIVIFDKLAYEDLLPVRWVPQPKPVDDVIAQHLAERNLRVLQACDALEEYGQLDKSKSDDDSSHSADIMRLDFKLNLLLDLASQLLAQSQTRGAPQTIRFNGLGATWKTDTPPPPGAFGILEVGIRDVVVQPLNLPAEAVATGPGEARVRFLSLGEVVADHIEKLVFRRHRRKIAGARQPRRA
jgi:hypothetical protein